MSDRVPALTITCHPDLSRIGERSVLFSLMLGQRVAVARGRPDFQALPAAEKRPLEDASISRKSLWLRGTAGGVNVDASEIAGGITVDGANMSGSVTLPHSGLEHGFTLELAGRVGLLLHNVEPKAFATAHGLLGGSEALRRLYLDIASAAAHSRPVVVLGEAGSGKELVARALHAESARAQGPWVAVNMATLPPEAAAAELFGYVKGAFAGANQASPGLIREAHQGTLFVDELAEASGELQAMMLRVMETGELRPLGSTAPVRVDVRWIGATAPHASTHRGSGTFRRPLWYRLGATEISVPPLRERRDDIARLWHHFMAEELAAAKRPSPAEQPVLMSPTLMTSLLGHGWPGNVRELRHAAIRYVVELLRDGAAAAEAALSARLEAATIRIGAAAAASDEAAGPPLLSREADADIDDATLTAALHDNRWKIAATAKQLGISKDALYRLIEQSPGLRKAADVELAEVLEARERCGHDVERMAASLQVSERALRQRMKDLGLS